MKIKETYETFLAQTGNDAVAASLTLAAVLQANVPDRPWTVPEVAKFLGVSPDKVLTWIRNGRLHSYNVAETETGRPSYRVSPDALKTFTELRTVRPAARPASRPKAAPVPVIATRWLTQAERQERAVRG